MGSSSIVTKALPEKRTKGEKFYKSFVLLASLSTQSLNQFSENMSRAEALSAEIAGIYRTSPERTGLGAKGADRMPTPMSTVKRLKERGTTPLTVFEK